MTDTNPTLNAKGHLFVQFSSLKIAYVQFYKWNSYIFIKIEMFYLVKFELSRAFYHPK